MFDLPDALVAVAVILALAILGYKWGPESLGCEPAKRAACVCPCKADKVPPTPRPLEKT